jgi:DNA-binding transcriptional ArsR family regulator
MLNHQRVDRVFQALSDSTRRAMVERLSKGPATVTELAEPLPLTLAAVVQHLAVLEESGVVRTEKKGRVRTANLEPEGLQLANKWLDERMALWGRRLDRLGQILAEPEAGEPATKRRKR